MRPILRPLVFLGLLTFAAPIWADDKLDVGPNLAAQAAADALRAFAGSDGAFIAGGQLKEGFSKDNLATMLTYATDDVVVMNLTGDQVRQALERSISMYPSANKSFLQISGFEATFKKNAGANRIVSVTVNGTPLENGKTYTVAMPSTLARGAVGYYRVWDANQTAKNSPKGTMEEVLRGKKATDGSPRWIAQG